MNKYLKNILQLQYETFQKLLKDEVEIDNILTELTAQIPEIKLLQHIPGVGPMTAITMLSVIDKVSRFENAKSFASYLGLVPRENSSGDKRRLVSITRSGSEVLRRYFIHGARSVIAYSSRQTKKPITDPNKIWALKLKDKIGMNKATVALAHRLSRIAFAVLRDGTIYEEKTYCKSEKQEIAKAA